MNVYAIAVPVVLTSAATLIAIQSIRREQAARITLEDTRPHLGERLAPFIGQPELAYHMNKEHLLEAIGGRAGLREVLKAVSAIITLSARKKWGDLWACARWTYLAGWPARLELYLREKYLPNLPIMFTEALVRSYVGLPEDIEIIQQNAPETMHEYP
jgi:hypothetical protein